SAAEHPDDRAEAVQEIEQRDLAAGERWIQPQHAGRHERKRRPEQDRLRQDEKPGEEPLRPAPVIARACRRQQRVVSPVCGRDEEPVEEERGQADKKLSRGVGEEGTSNALRVMAREPRPERQAADEDDQHDRLCVRRVSEEELEVMAPDRLVDEAAEAGNREEREKSAKAKRHDYRRYAGTAGRGAISSSLR